jgi:hypothetical protein
MRDCRYFRVPVALRIEADRFDYVTRWSAPGSLPTWVSHGDSLGGTGVEVLDNRETDLVFEICKGQAVNLVKEFNARWAEDASARFRSISPRSTANKPSAICGEVCSISAITRSSGRRRHQRNGLLDPDKLVRSACFERLRTILMLLVWRTNRSSEGSCAPILVREHSLWSME